MQKKDICDECNKPENKKFKVLECCGISVCSQCIKQNSASNGKNQFHHKCKKNYKNESKPINNENLMSNNNQSIRFDHQNLLKMKNKPQNCPEHHKPIQLICLQDKELLCSHCAIFGGHREHNLKTIQNFERELRERVDIINEIAQLKEESDLKLKGKDFQMAIIEELNKRKEHLIKEIREKYKNIYEMLKESEQKLYTDLIKAFRGINQEIKNLNKEKADLEKEYKGWWKQCKFFITNFQNSSTLPDKVQILYESSIEKLDTGRDWVKKIQQQNKNMKQTIIDLINGIGFETSSNLETNIYNFIQIKSNLPSSSTYFSEISPPASMNSIPVSTNSIPSLNSMSSSSIIPDKETEEKDRTKSILNPTITSKMKAQLSPKFNKTLPKKVAHSHKKLPPAKMIKKDDGIQIKHLENLAFAERMLNQFKTSKETLDMTGCDLSDEQVYCVVVAASENKNIQHLKISQNKLSNHGLLQIFPYFDFVSSVNLSYNQLTEEVLDEFINCKEGMPNLRIINLTHNRIINQRRAKAKMEELKKLGVMVTL